MYRLSEVQKKQPIINIGTIGHVAHGKSTLVKALTGKSTPSHSLEKLRNMTIFIGHANLYLYENDMTKDLHFTSQKITGEENMILKRHISIVDCPGHSHLMATMIGASKVFDGALLLIACNDTIPQIQTEKHVQVIEKTDIDDILIVLNKIDLIQNRSDIENIDKYLQAFIGQHSILQNKQIIPICAHQNLHLQQVAFFMSKIPCRRCNTENINKEFEMHILRSFDINHLDHRSVQGGVIGGSILSGYIQLNDFIVILPGFIEKNAEEGKEYKLFPIIAKVISLKSENEDLDIAFPGGLIAIGLDCDPSFCKQNRLIGSMVQKLNRYNIQNLKSLGFSQELIIQTEMNKPLSKNSNIYLIVFNKACKAIVLGQIEENKYKILLPLPICVSNKEKIPILANPRDEDGFLGYAQIVDSDNIQQLNFTFEFDHLMDQLPETFSYIEMIDDLPEFSCSFDFDFNISQLQTYFEENEAAKKSSSKIPQPLLVYEPLRILFKNMDEFNDFLIEKVSIYQNRAIKEFRVFPFSNVCISYFSYVYGIDYSEVYQTMEGFLQVNIKTKRLKHRLEKILSTLLKEYFVCQKCNVLTCRMGKINNFRCQYCFKCGDRILLKDEWISRIKL